VKQGDKGLLTKNAPPTEVKPRNKAMADKLEEGQDVS